MRSTYHQRRARGLMRGAVLVWAGAVAMACDSRKNPGTDTSAPAQSAGAQASSATLVTGKPSGQLKEPMAYYESNPAEFALLTDSLKWVGHYYSRDCSGGGCSGNAKATVLLEAIADANEVDVENLPANGVLMARMINVGKVKEKHYGIPPEGGEWFILYYGKPGEKKFNFVRLTFDQNNNPSVYWDETEHDFRGCGANGQPDQDHPKQKRAYAGFSGCDPHTPGHRASSASKQVWISCSLGCCSSDYPVFDLNEKEMPFQTPKPSRPAAKAATSQ